MLGRPGSRRTLIGADEIVIVAAPELASPAQRQEPHRRACGQPGRTTASRKIVLNHGRHAEAAGNRARRISRRRSRPSSLAAVPFDAAALRHGGQQRPDDRRDAAGGKITEVFVELAAAITGRQRAETPKADLLEPDPRQVRRDRRPPERLRGYQTACSGSVQQPDRGKRLSAVRAGRADRGARRRPPELNSAAPARSAAPDRRGRADADRRRGEKRKSEEYYQTKGMIFGALIEAIDLAQLSRLDRDARARGDPRHRQRDHRAQERRDVDRRAGGAARRHLQRRARLRPARAAAGARRHRRHHGQRRRTRPTSKSAARSSSPMSASATISS